MKIRFFENIGPDYLWRFRLIPKITRNGIDWYPPFNAFLHVIKRSDDDRALHDHPWPSWSILLRGELYEVTPNPHGKGNRLRRIPRFRVIYRPAAYKHRLWIKPGAKPPITLFMVGFKQRTWGFWPGDKFVPWREYLGLDDNVS